MIKRNETQHSCKLNCVRASYIDQLFRKILPRIMLEREGIKQNPRFGPSCDQRHEKKYREPTN